MPGLRSLHAGAGNLMVVALADVDGLQKVAYFTLKNLYQPGDTIHTTYVEDAAGTGGHHSMAKPPICHFCTQLLHSSFVGTMPCLVSKSPPQAFALGHP